jgi:prolipoprotein diacylglyceryltransferase
MTFPVEFHILGRSIPAHPVMEALGYCAGFQAYLMLRRKEIATGSAAILHVWVIAAAIVGAFLGSKILAIIESFPDYWAHRDHAIVWFQGQTIVGGLLGGWIGVEIVKRLRGVRESTGDAYVPALVVGVCIGRVGCFLTGLPDHTYGVATSLPWGIDFGDGIRRHPTQLYEIVAVMCIGVTLLFCARRTHARGEIFRWFMLLYLLFRFLIEFIKPTFKPYFGLSAIQIASLVGAIVCVLHLRSTKFHRRAGFSPHVIPLTTNSPTP